MTISRLQELRATRFPDLRKAYEFADAAHKSVGQKVPYTGQSYIYHSLAVAFALMDYTSDIEMLQAALLHDVLEDTPVTKEEIEKVFGQTVADYVDWVTKVSRESDGNRAARVAIDIAHLAKAPPAAKTIKLADILVNASTIAARDPQRAATYLPEKLAALDALTDGYTFLWNRVHKTIVSEIQQIDTLHRREAEETQRPQADEMDWLVKKAIPERRQCEFI